jgi:predicted RNase H-like HicB family nuclease
LNKKERKNKMEKVTVTVEMTDNNYSAYLEKLPGCISTGKTFEELKKNISQAVAFHIEGVQEDGKNIPISPDYELMYKFDPESLLKHYNGIFTNVSFEKMTGINQRQMQRYCSGASRPRPEQARRINCALHNLGKELLAIEL